MENKKLIKLFCGVILVVTIITLLLSIFYSSAFLSSFMLMLSLFLFGCCYYIKDDNKIMLYILFIIGVLLIVGSLVYTWIRIN